MTTPAALTKLYDQLSPEERFRLMVARTPGATR